LPKKPLVVDKMVDFLAKEDAFQERVYITGYQWAAREKETLRSQVRHAKKRRTLKNYVDRSANVSRHSVSLSIRDIDAEDREIVSVDNHSIISDSTDEEDDIMDLTVPLSNQTTTAASASASSDKSDKTSKKQRKREICHGCNKLHHINKGCTLHLCAQCCYDSPESCRPHNAKKLGAPKPYLETSLAISKPSALEKIQTAILKKHSVYILYSDGTGGTLRKIDPQKIVNSRNGSKVEALCHLRGGELRHFFLHKILRIEEHDWNDNGLPTSHAQGFLSPFELFFFFNI
jgi:hypothetical protein